MVTPGPLAQSHPVPSKTSRLPGLDIARFLAFIGMVMVNFTLAANADVSDGALGWADFQHMLEGKAAALFVILAGVGIGLGTQKAQVKGATLSSLRSKQIKRGLVLFGFGLLNLVIFDADILHYYGLYFLLACFVVGSGRKTLLLLAFLIIALSPTLLFVFDYDAGWNWQLLHYQDLWSLEGFWRNSLFNGFHPIFPWLAFLIFGMALAQLNLSSATARLRIAGAGIAMIFAGSLFAQMGQDIAALPEVASDPEFVELILALTGTSPMPPSPIYMISAIGYALLALVLCLWLGDWFGNKRWMQPVLATGQQALTLYIAHILIGMGMMEAIGWIAETGSVAARPNMAEVVLFTLIFLIGSMVYATRWRNILGAGPLERLLRKLSK